MIEVPDALSRLEQPEHTGENRCLPCTAVNVAIAIALAAAIGAFVSVPAGAVAFALSLALVLLRGYLVPGTPTLTRRYLPARVLEAFGKSPPAATTIETVSLEELSDTLLAAGVATVRDGAIRVSPSVRDRLSRRLSSDVPIEPGAADVRVTLGAGEVERLGDASFVLDGRKRVGWESTAALAADVAAAAVLRTRFDGWDALEVDERRDLLRGVRLLSDRCPVCDGETATTVDRLEHCCRRPRVGIRSVCEGCERPLVELVVTEPKADPWLELAGVTAAEDSTAER